MRGSDEATLSSDGRRFDGTLIVRAPAIRSALSDDDANFSPALSRAGAAVDASGPTNDPDRVTIAIATAASTPPALRPSAGRRARISMPRIGRSNSTNDIAAITRDR